MTTVAWGASFDTGCVVFATFTPENDAMATVPSDVAYVQRFPTDPIGSHTLTLTNVVIGSRIAIRDQANTTTFYDQIAATETVGISLSVYSAGSPLNDWLIRIRKATDAPYYQPYETQMTATVGSSSIYVNQLPDQR